MCIRKVLPNKAVQPISGEVQVETANQYGLPLLRYQQVRFAGTTEPYYWTYSRIRANRSIDLMPIVFRFINAGMCGELAKPISRSLALAPYVTLTLTLTHVPEQRLIGHIKNLVAKWPSIVQYMYLSYVVDQVYKRADLGYLACIGAGGPFWSLVTLEWLALGKCILFCTYVRTLRLLSRLTLTLERLWKD